MAWGSQRFLVSSTDYVDTTAMCEISSAMCLNWMLFILKNNRSPCYLSPITIKPASEIVHGLLSASASVSVALSAQSERDLWPWAPWLTEHYEMLIGHVTIYQTVIYCHVKCGKAYRGLIGFSNCYWGDLTSHLAEYYLDKIAPFMAIFCDFGHPLRIKEKNFALCTFFQCDIFFISS